MSFAAARDGAELVIPLPRQVFELQGEVGGLSYARSSADKGVFLVQISREMLIMANQIADRNFAAERFLAFSMLVAGIAMLLIGGISFLGIPPAAAVANAVTAMRAERAQLALVSDAGTPLVSDPGYRLVRAAREAGVRVSPLPGPCAAIAALSVAGLASDRFAFEGFLPAKGNARRERLQRLAGEPRTLVFYESSHRIEAMLADCAALLGEREAVLARELTKLHEEVWRGTLDGAAAWLRHAGALAWPLSVTLIVALVAAAAALVLVVGCLENEQRSGLRPSARGLWLLYCPSYDQESVPALLVVKTCPLLPSGKRGVTAWSTNPENSSGVMSGPPLRLRPSRPTDDIVGVGMEGSTFVPETISVDRRPRDRVDGQR